MTNGKAEQTTPSLERDLGTAFRARYQLVRLLGKGGFGTVYEADQIALRRRVAIKFLSAGLLATPHEIERFVREARLMTRLRHPALVPLLDVDFEARIPYLVSEFVDGRTLQARLAAAGPMDAREAMRYLRQLLEGLQYLHGEGFLHRDIKPANVMLTGESRLRLLDLGLALDTAERHRLTLPGMHVGTPAYMAPEQLLLDATGIPSDLYATGLVLYEMLAGRKAFPQSDVRASVAEKSGGFTTRLRESVLHGGPALVSTLDLLLAARPEQRFASAAHVLRHLDECEPPLAIETPATERPRRRWRVAAAVLIAVAIVPVLLRREPAPGPPPAPTPVWPGLSQVRQGLSHLAIEFSAEPPANWLPRLLPVAARWSRRGRELIASGLAANTPYKLTFDGPGAPAAREVRTLASDSSGRSGFIGAIGEAVDAVAFDGRGDLAGGAWRASATGGEPREIRTRWSPDSGATWGPLTAIPGNAGLPAVRCDATGAWIAWPHRESLRWRIRLARVTDGRPGPIADVAPLGDWDPRLQLLDAAPPILLETSVHHARWARVTTGPLVWTAATPLPGVASHADGAVDGERLLLLTLDEAAGVRRRHLSKHDLLSGRRLELTTLATHCDASELAGGWVTPGPGGGGHGLPSIGEDSDVRGRCGRRAARADRPGRARSGREPRKRSVVGPRPLACLRRDAWTTWRPLGPRARTLRRRP